MKKIFLTIMALFCLVVAEAQDFKTPIDYLNFIGKNGCHFKEYLELYQSCSA
jgi:hypothetical protein